MKFLIDTGADNNFIDPKHTNNFQLIPTKTEVKTALQTHTISHKISIDYLEQLNNIHPLEFLVFKFHHFFDGIIGNQTLQQLNATIDYQNSQITFGTVINKLHYKPFLKPQIYNLEPYEQKNINLPTNVKLGDIYAPSIQFNEHVHSLSGIYSSNNYQSQIFITNNSNSKQSIIISQPLRVESLNNYAEIHNFNTIAKETDYYENYQFALENLRMKHLNNEERDALINVCSEYRDVFYTPDQNMTFTSDIKHRIETTDDIPIYTKSYRYPFVHKEEVTKQINEMLEKNIIRPSNSPWSSPIWIVAKKADASGKKKWRLVIDYRKLNEKTIDDRYPLPNISDILDKLGKCQYFTTLDLASGFHQIEMDKRDIPKTAFLVDNGHYEFIWTQERPGNVSASHGQYATGIHRKKRIGIYG